MTALSAVLSDDERARTLAAALLALDRAGLDRAVARLGTETGGLVRAVIAKRRGKRRVAPVAGAAKIRQEWARAWRDWHDCILESGDEDAC